MNVRSTAKELAEQWEAHARKVASGEIARRQGPALQIDESIDKELRRLFESFLNGGVRVLKQGMQTLAAELQIDIAFMFKKPAAFETGIKALRRNDPLMADYLRQSRLWTERLVETRNDVEHEGCALPRVSYQNTASGVTAVEPEIAGQPVTQFVKVMLDRLCCFVEEFTAHSLQMQMPPQIVITEIIRAARRPEAPERFSLTLGVGGFPQWNLAYHASSFEEV
jgi:hypothetical protein